MRYEESPLNDIVTRVQKEGKHSGNYIWSIEFQILPNAPIQPTAENGAVGDRELEGFFNTLAILNIDINRSYESDRKYEHFNAIIALTGGVWAKFILPNREFLRVHLTRRALTRRGGDLDDSSENLVLVYKPLFRIDPSNNAEVTQAQTLSRFDLDQKGLMELDVDFIDPVIEQFAKTLVGGEAWRNAKANQVMVSYFSKHNAGVEIDGEKVMKGISMPNKTMDIERPVIGIKQAVKLLDIPALLHEKHGGIWPTGCSCFLQDRVWYFWPPYDTEPSGENTYTGTLTIVPSQGLQNNEKTFLLDGDHLHILASSTSPLANIQQQRFLKEGDGVRFTSPNKMIEGWAERKDNKIHFRRSGGNSEMQLNDPRNASHFAPQAPEAITDNNLFQLSRLASRRGFQLFVEWQNADHTLIKPGMMFTIVALINGEIEQFYGRVAQLQVSFQKTEIGVSSKTMTSTVGMVLFCNFPQEG